jgi:hypothetical protein
LPADAWIAYPIETLQINMETVLTAVAQGCVCLLCVIFCIVLFGFVYRTTSISNIVFDTAQKNLNDVLIQMKFVGLLLFIVIIVIIVIIIFV